MTSDTEAARWRLAYAARLVQEDVRDLERVREIERLELLYDRLGDIVGGVLSINSLREDLEVAFETVRSWIAGGRERRVAGVGKSLVRHVSAARLLGNLP